MGKMFKNRTPKEMMASKPKAKPAAKKKKAVDLEKVGYLRKRKQI